MKKTSFSLYKTGGSLVKIQIKQLCQQYTHNVTKDMVKSIKILEDEIQKFQEEAQLSGNQRHIESLFFFFFKVCFV